MDTHTISFGEDSEEVLRTVIKAVCEKNLPVRLVFPTKIAANMKQQLAECAFVWKTTGPTTTATLGEDGPVVTVTEGLQVVAPVRETWMGIVADKQPTDWAEIFAGRIGWSQILRLLRSLNTKKDVCFRVFFREGLLGPITNWLQTELECTVSTPLGTTVEIHSDCGDRISQIKVLRESDGVHILADVDQDTPWLRSVLGQIAMSEEAVYG